MGPSEGAQPAAAEPEPKVWEVAKTIGPADAAQTAATAQELHERELDAAIVKEAQAAHEGAEARGIAEQQANEALKAAPQAPEERNSAIAK